MRILINGEQIDVERVELTFTAKALNDYVRTQGSYAKFDSLETGFRVDTYSTGISLFQKTQIEMNTDGLSVRLDSGEDNWRIAAAPHVKVTVIGNSGLHNCPHRVQIDEPSCRECTGAKDMGFLGRSEDRDNEYDHKSGPTPLPPNVVKVKPDSSKLDSSQIPQSEDLLAQYLLDRIGREIVAASREGKMSVKLADVSKLPDSVLGILENKGYRVSQYLYADSINHAVEIFWK